LRSLSRALSAAVGATATGVIIEERRHRGPDVEIRERGRRPSVDIDVGR
jgi:hypothetical protein